MCAGRLFAALGRVNCPDSVIGVFNEFAMTTAKPAINNDFDSTPPPTLYAAIEEEYYRFEPFLRKALQEYVDMEHREYIDDPNKGPRQFFVSFYDLPRTEKVRSKTISINFPMHDFKAFLYIFA